MENKIPERSRIKKNIALFGLLLFYNGFAMAQSTADSAVKMYSPVKTLTDDRYQAYLKAEDYDHMSLVAEFNGFPLPDKVLKYKKELALTVDQEKTLHEIYSYMHRRRLQAGGSMIANEKMLDSLFKTQRLNDGVIIFYTNRYGLYTGELRNAVLQACYATRKVLTPLQLNKYRSLKKSN